ncbi:MAG: L-lactate permease [Thermoanaerobaculaceae bacterium]|jgi:lactate permease|nr:L-lactate permease [Thermoanaerobaculaceae bacterium]
MLGLSVVLALLPVVVIFLLLVIRKTPADIAGLVGWGLALGLAVAYFHTPASTGLWASLAGSIASWPIALMVATSIFQITVMAETGALARIVTLIKTVSPNDKVVQVLIINFGFGTLIAAMGATPVSILPPIMLALGYTSFVSIALPALGYDALCTYALLGVPVVVFSDLVGLSVPEVGGFFARYMPVISTCIAFGMMWIVGRWKMMLKGFFPTLAAGLVAGFITIGMNELKLIPLTGIVAGLGVILVMLAWLKVRGLPLLDRSILTADDLAQEQRMPLWRALSPWLILVVFSFLVNLPQLPFYELTFKKLAMPIEIIPGRPERVRLLWQAYFWILVSTLLALPLLRATGTQMASSVRKWAKRAPRPVLAAAVFFALAYVLNHSGKGLDWKLVAPTHNMIFVVADASARLFGKAYPFIAPFLGLLGGFISGSEASSLAILTKLHLSTSERIGALGLLVAAASGIGGGLASVISPAKLQNAAATIDRIGEEGKVIPVCAVISVVITTVCALMTMLWAY